jgi:hypothetical protein
MACIVGYTPVLLFGALLLSGTGTDDTMGWPM